MKDRYSARCMRIFEEMLLEISGRYSGACVACPRSRAPGRAAGGVPHALTLREREKELVREPVPPAEACLRGRLRLRRVLHGHRPRRPDTACALRQARGDTEPGRAPLHELPRDH